MLKPLHKNERAVSQFIQRADKKRDITKPLAFTLRISHELMMEIDEARKTRVGRVTRTLWILEAIEKALQ